LVSWYLRTPL